MLSTNIKLLNHTEFPEDTIPSDKYKNVFFSPFEKTVQLKAYQSCYTWNGQA